MQRNVFSSLNSQIKKLWIWRGEGRIDIFVQKYATLIDGVFVNLRYSALLHCSILLGYGFTAAIWIWPQLDCQSHGARHLSIS